MPTDTLPSSNFDDPEDIPGLAHFIEHMIFMGSQKYPKENEYDSVINRFGGSNNAETDAEETCFYFDVPLPGLESVLDVFSNLFHCPLFVEDTIDRELSAIDSEFDQARQSNDVRCDAVLAQFMNGPASKFNYGNRESLTKVGLVELQQRAKDFWMEHYLAQHMYLAIQAKMPLDELEVLVEKHFAKLRGQPRTSVTIPEKPQQPITRGRPRDYQSLTIPEIFKDSFSDQLIHVEAIDNKIELILTWPIPSQAAEYHTKPCHFLEQLLDHEGSGGLVRRLKERHLIQRMDAQVHEGGNDDNSMFSLFCVTLRLSKHGYRNIPQILECVQGYLRLLQREEGQWKGYYDQLQCIYESQFRFQGEQRMMDDVQRLSTYLKYFPEERVLDGCHLYFEYSQDLIRALVDRLVSHRPSIMICSQQKQRPFAVEEEETEAVPSLVEYYTQAKYTLSPIPEQWKAIFEMTKEDARIDLFSFPPPNQFVTTDFTVLNKVTLDSGSSLEYPRKIAETDLYELWFKPDRKFGLPKLFVNLQLILPLVCNNIRNTVLLDLFGAMLSREIIQVLHGANVAGYGCTMVPKPLGVTICMTGFSQRLPSILTEVLSKLNEGFPKYASSEQFELLKEEMLCSYVNALLYVDGLSAELLNAVIEDGHFAAYDKYQELHTICFSDVLKFSEVLFKEFRMKCLVQGNATEEGAQQFVQMIVDGLRPEAVSEERRRKLTISAVELPKGELNSLRVAAFNKTDVNSSFCQYYEVGQETVALDCALQLMLLIMEEPLFDTLRTKKQLGYDVGAQVKYNHGLVGFCVTVVSQESKFTLDEVEAEVNDFVLEEFAAHLEDMDDEDFEESRSALIELKGMPDQDLEEEMHRNWGEIWNETYNFDRLAKEREWLRQCTKEDVLELYDGIVDEQKRKLLCVQVKGTEVNEDEEKEAVEEEDKDKKPKDFTLQVDKEWTPVEGAVLKDIAEFRSKCTRHVRRRGVVGTEKGDCNKEG